MKEPTYFPNVEGQRQNVLDLFVTSDAEKYEVHNLASRGPYYHICKFLVLSIYECLNPIPEA